MDTHAKEAVQYIKSKGFTHIKIELEAVFFRGHAPSCANCNDTGTIPCVECLGKKFVVKNGDVTKCSACKRSSKCPYKHLNWNNNTTLQQYLSGLLTADERRKLNWFQVYTDPSVDTELTYTLPITELELAVKIIKNFADIGIQTGKGIDVAGAGMHIALMDNSSYNYCNFDSQSMVTFKRSMKKLMPALFFLGSPNHYTRKVHYRMPTVSSQKYSAINVGRVIEYRVFDPCYDKPEMLYEFVEVIAKTLTFYCKPKDNPLPTKILYARIPFRAGNDGFNLQRLFDEPDLIDALDMTLPYLKPNSKTIQQLKKERGFNLSRSQLIKQQAMEKVKLRNIWKNEFKERLNITRKLMTDFINDPEKPDREKMNVQAMLLDIEIQQPTNVRKFITHSTKTAKKRYEVERTL